MIHDRTIDLINENITIEAALKLSKKITGMSILFPDVLISQSQVIGLKKTNNDKECKDKRFFIHL